MIALDPDFVGSLAPPTKLTTAVHDKHDIPFARLPRLERLRVEGKADETEIDDAVDAENDGDGTEDERGKKHSREEREKRKMRGKGKSLKRCVQRRRLSRKREPTSPTMQVFEKATQERHRPYRGSYDVAFTCSRQVSSDMCLVSQVNIRAKLEKQREERRVAKAIAKGEMEPKKPSALDRFRRA